MDQQEIIADLEARARAAGLTITEACKRAGLHPTTFSRWKKSERNPSPVGANFASLTKLQAVIPVRPTPSDQAAAA